MTSEEELLGRIATLERAVSMLTHPCIGRIEDLQAVIIRMQGEKLKAIHDADMKKQTSSTGLTVTEITSAKLNMVANDIEFGHSHGA